MVKLRLWILCTCLIRPALAQQAKETAPPLKTASTCCDKTALTKPQTTSIGRQDPSRPPKQVRAFLGDLLGTWCHVDKSSKDILDIGWDAGSTALIIHRQGQWGNRRRVWTESWFWDAASENGACSSHGCSSLGFSTPLKAQAVYPESAISEFRSKNVESIIPSSVNSENEVLACKRVSVLGNLINVTFRIEFNGPNQITRIDTIVFANGKQREDVIRVFARSCLPVTLKDI